MADMHISSELLEAIARGEIPVRVLEDMILEHLKKVCPHCKGELEEFARKQEAERRAKCPGPGFEVVAAVLDRHLRDLQRGQDRARRDVEKLLLLSQDERIARIRRSRTRYRGRQVVWVLLEESRAAVTASPEEAPFDKRLALYPEFRRWTTDRAALDTAQVRPTPIRGWLLTPARHGARRGRDVCGGRGRLRDALMPAPA